MKKRTSILGVLLEIIHAYRTWAKTEGFNLKHQGFKLRHRDNTWAVFDTGSLRAGLVRGVCVLALQCRGSWVKTGWDHFPETGSHICTQTKD